LAVRHFAVWADRRISHYVLQTLFHLEDLGRLRAIPQQATEVQFQALMRLPGITPGETPKKSRLAGVCFTVDQSFCAPQQFCLLILHCGNKEMRHW